MKADRRTDDLKAEIASALAPVVERDAGDAGAHPDLDELVRYHGGELGEADEERVQRHLVACPECQEDLLDLDGFVAAGGGRREGGSDGTATEPGRPSAVSSIPHPAPSRRPALALAASFLIAALSLGVWAIQERNGARELRREMDRLSAPRPDLPIVDLLPDSSARSGAAEEPPATVPPGEDLVTFVLNLPRAPEVSGFEVEVLDADGEVTWTGPVAISPYGTFTLGLWRRSMSPGENRIVLYGLDGGDRRLLEAYTFRVEAP